MEFLNNDKRDFISQVFSECLVNYCFYDIPQKRIFRFNMLVYVQTVLEILGKLLDVLFYFLLITSIVFLTVKVVNRIQSKSFLSSRALLLAMPPLEISDSI